jgi:hypothetical protein
MISNICPDTIPEGRARVCEVDAADPSPYSVTDRICGNPDGGAAPRRLLGPMMVRRFMEAG